MNILYGCFLKTSNQICISMCIYYNNASALNMIEISLNNAAHK